MREKKEVEGVTEEIERLFTATNIHNKMASSQVHSSPPQRALGARFPPPAPFILAWVVVRAGMRLGALDAWQGVRGGGSQGLSLATHEKRARDQKNQELFSSRCAGPP